MAELKDREEEKLIHAVVLLNAKVLGLIMGILFGLIIFIATIWLVIKSGPLMGQHLQLLSNFFIGYRVSFLGSIIGFFWGFAIGSLVGTSIGWIYNWIVDLRN